MTNGDVTETLEPALQASGCDLVDESLMILTPAHVYLGRGQSILENRKQI